ncbi:MAG: hypothetical protein HOV81_34975 [Kofleriaceae bacterium]|nr:hypothetical protein [Kofleriaceae bacterium]
MKWLTVICVALVAGACADHDVNKLAKVRDEVCHCKTASCAETAMKLIPKDTKEPSRKEQRIAREMLDCLAEIYASDRPTTDPDAPVESPAP